MARQIKDSLGHDYRYEHEHRQVGVERLEMGVGLVAAKRGGLAHREAERERPSLERIGTVAGRIGRREDMNDFLAARQKRIQRLFRKRRLPNQSDSQVRSSRAPMR
jgi:hypothetical protein